MSPQGPKAPNPGQSPDLNEQGYIQDTLFNDTPHSAEIAPTQPAVPEPVETAAIEEVQSPEETAEHDSITVEIQKLEARKKAVECLTKEEGLDQIGIDMRRKISGINHANLILRDDKVGESERLENLRRRDETIDNEQINKYQVQQKRRDGMIAFGKSIGIEAKQVSVDNPAITGDPEDDKGKPKTLKVVKTTDPTEQKRLEEEYKTFWYMYSGKNSNRVAARKLEVNRIIDNIAILTSKEIKELGGTAPQSEPVPPAYQLSIITPKLLDEVQKGLKKKR